MLASRFRFATEDADIAEIPKPWPAWLTQVAGEIAAENAWAPGWLNDSIQFHLSPIADHAAVHLEFSTFPSGGKPGLRVFVPTAEYLLALKLKAFRINDPAKGRQETADIQNRLRAAAVADIDSAIGILAKFFPRSGADGEKQRFLLRHIWPKKTGNEPPAYTVLRR